MPTVLWSDISQIILSWSQPSSNGASPILGYQLFMKQTSQSTYMLVYDGSYNPATTYYTITSYNSSALSNISYDFQLVAMNVVGGGPPSPILTIVLTDLPYGPNCPVSGSGLTTFPANTVMSITVNVK